MATEINVPTLGESVTSATVARWMKHEGEAVAADEPLVELETDKVTVEVNAPAAGVLTSISAPEGSEVAGRRAARPVGSGGRRCKRRAQGRCGARATTGAASRRNATGRGQRAAARARAGRASSHAAGGCRSARATAGRRQADRGTASLGRADRRPAPARTAASPRATCSSFLTAPRPSARRPAGRQAAARRTKPREERVKMTRLRRTIAARLKEAQNTAAMLTTFNEVDMSAVMALRSEYRDAFEKKHNGVRLGFMCFFVRACVRRAEGIPGGQRRDRRRRHRLQELRPHGHRRRRTRRAGGAGDPRCRPAELRRDRSAPSPISAGAPATAR